MVQHVRGNNRTSKDQLVAALQEAAGINFVEADFYYDVFVNEMVKRLQKGKDVVLAGLGTLDLIKHRAGKSNMTGQQIPPHKRLKFYPDARFARKIRVNTREHPIN